MSKNCYFPVVCSVRSDALYLLPSGLQGRNTRRVHADFACSLPNNILFLSLYLLKLPYKCVGVPTK